MKNIDLFEDGTSPLYALNKLKRSELIERIVSDYEKISALEKYIEVLESRLIKKNERAEIAVKKIREFFDENQKAVEDIFERMKSTSDYSSDPDDVLLFGDEFVSGVVPESTEPIPSKEISETNYGNEELSSGEMPISGKSESVNDLKIENGSSNVELPLHNKVETTIPLVGEIKLPEDNTNREESAHLADDTLVEAKEFDADAIINELCERAKRRAEEKRNKRI